MTTPASHLGGPACPGKPHNLILCASVWASPSPDQCALPPYRTASLERWLMTNEWTVQMHKHHCIHSRGHHSSPLCDLSDGEWGLGGSLSEHIQRQGAHYLVSIYLPTMTRASQSHSSSSGNAGPSSRMPWSLPAGSASPISSAAWCLHRKI